MGRHGRSIDGDILKRIRRRGRGVVFTPNESHDLGSSVAVRLALMRHVRAGVIRRLDRGLYDYPKHDADLGALAPSTEAIAEALRGRGGIRLQPSGAHAAHLLGLTDQVPVRAVFLTDGPQRRVKLRNHRAVFFRKRAETRDSLQPGTLNVVPSVDQMPEWRRDYEAMRTAMFRGDPPGFEALIATARDLQDRFNAMA